MKKNTNASKNIAKVTASLLKTSLVVSANTTSCTVVHQPKAPQGLKQFSKVK